MFKEKGKNWLGSRHVLHSHHTLPPIIWPDLPDSGELLKVPIKPKLLFWLNKYMYNSEQNGAKIFELGQNQNFL